MTGPLPGQLEGLDGDIVQLVHENDAYLLPGLPAERTVLTCHDLFPLRMVDEDLGLGRARGGVGEETLLWARHLADMGHIACISESTRVAVLRYIDIDPERTSVVHNGLGRIFRPLPIERVRQVRSGLPKADHYVMAVGGGLRKNVPAMLRVLSKLRAGGLDVALVRVGSPLVGEKLGLARSLGIERSVVDVGRISDDRLVELYNACDVLLFPSYSEGFGWPPLEAMACGTPAVVSTADPFPEILGDAALAAAADDIEGLAEQISSLLTDDATAQRMRAVGLKHAAVFTWERTAQHYLEIYRRLLDR